MITVRKLFAVLLSGSLLFGASAAAAGRWTHYRPTSGNGPTLIVKTRCLSAEDSAGHLTLRSYGPDRVTYGCSRKGY